jgi:3-hydroxy acid dehydrogenase / malonic semialdehyde reductase
LKSLTLPTMPKPTAVITGASRGIGRATALRLAPTHQIVAVARSADDLDGLRREIDGMGGSCRPVALDITDPSAVQGALAGIEADVLVNNAGIGVIKPFMELTRDEWRSMVDVNFNALYDVTRAVLPSMIARRTGHVVVIGSISGRSAFIGATCYAATKAAVQAFTESLMLELRDHGIKVSVVSPGAVDTNFSGKQVPPLRSALGRDDGPSWKLHPGDVAEAVAAVIETPPNVLIHRMEVRTLTVPNKK